MKIYPQLETVQKEYLDLLIFNNEHNNGIISSDIAVKIGTILGKLLPILDTISSLIKDCKLKEFSIKNFKDKNVYFYDEDYFIHKKISNICKSITTNIDEADIIVYSDYLYSKIDEIHFEEFHLSRAMYHLSIDRFKLYYNYAYIIDNNYKIVDNYEIIIDNLIDEFIPKDVQESIKLMIASEDKEIFELGWDTLWNYDYVKNKDIILVIFGNTNVNFNYVKELYNYLYEEWTFFYPSLKNMFNYGY